MSSGGIDPAEIPEQWRQIVVRILRKGAGHTIHSTKRSRSDWEQTFPDANHYDRYDAMADALEDLVTPGKKIYGMKEKGEVYAFWFYFDRRRLYGKINLFPSGHSILIYSSHLPRREDRL